MPHNGMTKVPSGRDQKVRSPSPNRRSRQTRSPSPTRKGARPTSPTRNGARPTSPTRKEARPASPTRKGAQIPQIRKVERALSPTRNGVLPSPESPQREGHTLEQFSKLNFMKPSKRPVVISKAGPNATGKIWQHTTEPITRPLLYHLVRDQQLSSRACAAFKAIMKYMGDFSTKKSNLQGNLITDKIFQDAMRYGELKDEMYCQIMKQLTTNKLSSSEGRGWELMWLATGIFTCSPVLEPELTKFLRSARHKLALDCLHRLQVVLQSTRRRKYPPHWVEVETIQHNFTQIFHFVFFPDDKSNASFQVSSSVTVGDLCRSITSQLGLASGKGFGLFLIMANKIVALDDESEFFFDGLRRRIDWEEEGIKSTKKSDMPVLAYQMFFLRKIWTDVVPGVDSVADTVFHYHQELPKFLRGYHKCSREEAVKLATLQFKAHYGNDKTELQNIAKNLKDFLPTDLVQSGSAEDWKRAILSMYNQSSMTSITKDAAKTAYLKIVYKWPTFGSSFFEVAKVARSSNAESLLLAINKRGMMMIDIKTKDILKTYPYSEIQGWAGSEANDFYLTVGTEKDGLMKLHFKTKLGYKMDDLLISYVRYMQKRPSSTVQNSTQTKTL